MTLVRSNFSFKSARDWISYYPHDLNKIKLLSKSAWDQISYYLHDLAGSSFSIWSTCVWISYYSHDFSEIELLSWVGVGSDFLLFPRFQQDQAILPGVTWDWISNSRHNNSEIELLSLVSMSSTSRVTLKCSTTLVPILLNDSTFRLDLVDHSYSSTI